MPPECKWVSAGMRVPGKAGRQRQVGVQGHACLLSHKARHPPSDTQQPAKGAQLGAHSPPQDLNP